MHLTPYPYKTAGYLAWQTIRIVGAVHIGCILGSKTAERSTMQWSVLNLTQLLKSMLLMKKCPFGPHLSVKHCCVDYQIVCCGVGIILRGFQSKY